MSENSQSAADLPKAPRSLLPASIDDKGRLKLPVEAVAYLKALGIKQVFTTSVDMELIRVYPIHLWDENIARWENDLENPVEAQQMILRTMDLGKEDEIDSAGKVLLSQELRQKMGLDRQPVKIRVSANGVVDVFSQKEYSEKVGASYAAGPDLWIKFRQKGFH